MLERAGVERADLVIAVTGDDEDNIIVCQVAKEKYGVPKVIARVNDPRNQPHFDMVGITLTVSATRDDPGADRARAAAARAGDADRPAAREPGDRRVRDRRRLAGGRPAVRDLQLPDRSRLISVSRDGRSEIAVGDTGCSRATW